jgi:TPR repeat protein
LSGLGVSKDQGKANRLFQKACDGGQMNGCANLGYSYWIGRGVSRDRQKGSRLLKKACDGGNDWACKKLR